MWFGLYKAEVVTVKFLAVKEKIYLQKIILRIYKDIHPIVP